MLYKNGISVVIPTYNRRDLLNNTLLSLCLQTFDLDNYEVIVVDDGSSDDTEQIVRSFKDRIYISYIYQEDKGFRVAKARNAGILNARYCVCLFLDSGVIAHPKLLESHWLLHRNRPELALIGYAYGYCDNEDLCSSLLKPFNRKSELENVFDVFRSHPLLKDRRAIVMENNAVTFSEITIPWIVFWTCHVSCSTKALMRLKGFDESFQSWGGEDIELGLRLHKSGVQFDVAENCEVIHSPHERYLIPSEKSNQYIHYIYKNHPSKATYLMTLGNLSWIEVVKSIINDVV